MLQFETTIHSNTQQDMTQTIVVINLIYLLFGNILTLK